MRAKAGNMLEEKGFLGPIGDDLPSLIPLIFALIIFFTVFSQTFSTFDERNTMFRDSLTVVRLSDVFVGNSYIVSDEEGSKQFDKMCETGQSIRTINWKAGLMELDTCSLERKGQGRFRGIDVQELDSGFFSLQINPVTAKLFSCSNTEEPLNYFSENVIVRFYPVALEVNLLQTENKKFYVKPMLLVIVAWK